MLWDARLQIVQRGYRQRAMKRHGVTVVSNAADGRRTMNKMM